MPRTDWISKGRSIDSVFIDWIKYNSTIIIPNFKDVLFPPVKFTNKKKLVTLRWDTNTFYYNVNRRIFPNVEDVCIVGDSYPLKHSKFHFEVGNYDHFYNPNNQIQWKPNEWVNEEWLQSQFNECFALIQKHQNELRKQLK